jgi:hypothetical protein
MHLLVFHLSPSRELLEKYSNIKFHENCSVGNKLFHADRLTKERTELIVDFRNFVNTPKNCIKYFYSAYTPPRSGEGQYYLLIYVAVKGETL